MPYAAGWFDMSDPPSFVETPFEPQGIFFFGGNQSTEDALIEVTNAGAFFGSAWRDVETEAIDQQANASAAPMQYHFYPAAISIGSTSGAVVDYRATVSSMEEGGFGLSIVTAASAYRPVHWLAYGDFQEAGPSAHGTASLVSFDQATLTFELDYQPWTGLMYHFWPLGGGRDIQGDGGNFHSMGTNNFPGPGQRIGGILGPNTRCGNGAIRVFSQLGAVGFTSQWFDHFGESATSPTIRPWVAGTYLEAIDSLSPYPDWETGGEAHGIYMHASGYTTRHVVHFWTSEGCVSYAGVPDLGEEQVYAATENIEEVEAALFFGSVGYTSAELLNPNCAYMFGVLTPEHQGCVAYDLGIGELPATGVASFFQSRQYCNVLNLHSGVRAASGVIDGTDIILTGEVEDSSPSHGANFMQRWGDVSQPTVMQRRRHIGRIPR
jgi:hypothetical protein